MRDYLNSFTYKGINSLDMGLIIAEKSNAYNKADPVIETISVPARGTLIVDNRTDELDNPQFNDYTEKYICYIDIDMLGISLEEHARRLYAWLYSGDISFNKLYDTYDEDYYTLAYVSSNASITDLARRLLGKIEIEFTCKAYKRSIKGDKLITLTEATTLNNPEAFTSLPYIKIYGSGNITLSINNRSHAFKDVSEYIEIDSELMNAYKDKQLQNNKMLTTLFPKFAAGANNINWIGNVTKVDIISRWTKL